MSKETDIVSTVSGCQIVISSQLPTSMKLIFVSFKDWELFHMILPTTSKAPGK